MKNDDTEFTDIKYHAPRMQVIQVVPDDKREGCSNGFTFPDCLRVFNVVRRRPEWVEKVDFTEENMLLRRVEIEIALRDPSIDQQTASVLIDELSEIEVYLSKE